MARCPCCNRFSSGDACASCIEAGCEPSPGRDGVEWMSGEACPRNLSGRPRRVEGVPSIAVGPTAVEEP